MNEVIADGSAISNSNLRTVAKLLKKQQSNARKVKINLIVADEKSVLLQAGKRFDFAAKNIRKIVESRAKTPVIVKVTVAPGMLSYQDFRKIREDAKKAERVE